MLAGEEMIVVDEGVAAVTGVWLFGWEGGSRAARTGRLRNVQKGFAIPGYARRSRCPTRLDGGSVRCGTGLCRNDGSCAYVQKGRIGGGYSRSFGGRGSESVPGAIIGNGPASAGRGTD